MAQKLPTFKNDTPPTGLARVGWNAGSDIRFGGMSCGRIGAPHPGGEREYRVRFTVVDTAGSNCGWKWITLKAKFNTLDEAKQFVKDSWPTIADKYPLRFTEPY